MGQLVNIDPLTCIVNWRKHNDLHGDAEDDKVLRKVANVPATQLKSQRDLVAHYGGEEFILLLPNNGSLETLQLTEICREAIENLALPHEGLEKPSIITLSTRGAACWPTQKLTPECFFSVADDMLYVAKRDGKNQVLGTKTIPQSANQIFLHGYLGQGKP